VLIKVSAAGVNPVETFVRSGMSGRSSDELPFTPGTDCAGVVVRVGADVTRLKVNIAFHLLTGSDCTLCSVAAVKNTASFRPMSHMQLC